jgi:hypothetical protein
VKKLGCVSATGEHLLPIFSGFFTEDTKEQEDKETLKGIKDSEKSLKGLPKSWCREGEYSKEPGESKEEHHSTDADHQAYDGFVAD